MTDLYWSCVHFASVKTDLWQASNSSFLEPKPIDACLNNCSNKGSCNEGEIKFLIDFLQLTQLMNKFCGLIFRYSTITAFIDYLKKDLDFFFLPGPKSLILDRYYFHPRVCVCVCVCDSLPKLSQKVLNRF